MSLKYAAISAAFEALWLSRLPGLVRTLSSARGVIFTLHRVLPETPPDFAPNAILQVRPDFLDYVIERLRHLGVEPVSLDEAIARLAAPTKRKPFAVFTFDDAYKDNREHALPILERHDCPFTLYVPTALVDGTGQVWWQAIEDIIRANNQITLEGEDSPRDTLTTLEKQTAYDTLYWRMRTMPEAERVALLHAFAARHGFDLAAHCASLIMNWDELAAIAAHPLCTVGAHTVHHYELAKLPPDEARAEMRQSADIIARRLGRRPTHLSYPIGGPASAGEREFAAARELGFASGVTTRPGGLYPHHMEALHALPRVSLNGLFQNRRYVDVFATGALFTWLGKLGA
jgi:peptidoglycan/xylan/chitin deacetylase (PgdA/CDA1 family)